MGKEADFPMRLDRQVTHDPKHLIRLPFTIHPRTNKVVVPFDPAEVADFDIDIVPTLTDAINVKDILKPYCDVAFDTLIKGFFDRGYSEWTNSSGREWIGKQDIITYSSQDSEPAI